MDEHEFFGLPPGEQLARSWAALGPSPPIENEDGKPNAAACGYHAGRSARFRRVFEVMRHQGPTVRRLALQRTRDALPAVYERLQAEPPETWFLWDDWREEYERASHQIDVEIKDRSAAELSQPSGDPEFPDLTLPTEPVDWGEVSAALGASSADQIRMRAKRAARRGDDRDVYACLWQHRMPIGKRMKVRRDVLTYVVSKTAQREAAEDADVRSRIEQAHRQKAAGLQVQID